MSLSDAIAHVPGRRGWLRMGAGAVRALPANVRLFSEHPFLRISHRGAAALEPENSLRGIDAALRYGVEMVEVDVRPCAEGILVLCHDDDLRRMTGYGGRVGTTTLATLKKLDIGKGERIPTLEEALDLMRGRVLVNLDLKRDSAVPRLLRAIDRAGRREETMLSGNRRRGFAAFAALTPAIRSACSFDATWGGLPGRLLGRYATAGARGQAGWIVRATRASGAHGSTLDWRLAAPAVVDRLHRASLPVLTWTVDDLPTLRALRAAGVDGVTSNRPDLLAQLE
jgi:glycerophosphoryl diester phosphodiesterase